MVEDGIDSIAKRSVNTLILVHLKELLYQWIDRLNAFLDVSDDQHIVVSISIR